MDSLNSTDIPKDEAVSYAIDQAVEMFIAGNVEKSNHFFDMAETFYLAPAVFFEPKLPINQPA
jgi:hypothetical protein